MTVLIDTSAVVRLADKTLTSEESLYTGFSPDLSSVMGEVLRQEKEAALKDAAETMTAIVRAYRRKITSDVQYLRALRSSVNRKKSDMNELNAAFEYGKATNNMVPLCVKLGLISASEVDNKELLNVDPSKIPAAPQAPADSASS